MEKPKPTSEQTAQRTTLRWGWIVTCIVAGALLVAAAWLLDLAGANAILTSTLVNIGSALLLAWVLFLLESRFTRKVTRTVERAAEATEERLAAQTERLVSSRLADLEERVAAAEEAERQAAQQRVDHIVEDVTAGTIGGALQAASDDGLISADGVSVPAREGAQHLFVRFWFGSITTVEDGWNSEHSGLLVSVQASSTDKPYVLKPNVDIEWGDDQPFTALIPAIRRELRINDFPRVAALIDWTFVITSLQKLLSWAEEQRTADPPFEGKTEELIDGEWVLTTYGLENHSTRERINRADIVDGVNLLAGQPLRDITPVAQARSISGETWRLLVDRVDRHTNRHFPTNIWPTAYNDETPF